MLLDMITYSLLKKINLVQVRLHTTEVYEYLDEEPNKIRWTMKGYCAKCKLYWQGKFEVTGN
jgi:hypothetical protein